ncbi:hypothetical protein SDC9_162083 [bioreactor metagenome]|uniref:AAA+ ATPase domain-containing protein n=1 Tax=bioreactor metagenome TaxID=1076179 RepID=A0A645FRC6_9ZZZZ
MQPNLVVIAGPNGAGKTSLTSKILKHKWIADCVYINPDNIARDTFGDWNSPVAVMQAARLSTEMRENYLLHKASICFETVLSSDEKVDFIKRAKHNGYFIRLFFVGTTHPSINAARVAQRVIEGGHDVPIPKIISRYSKSIINCAILSNIVDRLYVYDNSIDFAEPILVFRAKCGTLQKIYVDIAEWSQLIFQTIQKI